MYELLCGMPPFNDDTVPLIFENITNHNLEWPEVGYEEGCISPESYDLLNKLLNPNWRERLGSKGAEEIKKHPFFKDVDF